MLKLFNPDLPTEDQGFVVETNRLFQLYSDPASRENGGIIARIERVLGGVEEVYFSPPIGKGFFHRFSFDRNFSQVVLDDLSQTSRPSLLTPDRFWRKNLEMGVYSKTPLTGINTFQIIELEQYRQLDPTSDALFTVPDLIPTKVSSLGYVYAPGSGDNQWEYVDPLLTIHTTTSSQVLPNQEIVIEGGYAFDVTPPLLQILTFFVGKDAVILGADLLGRSFTPAYDNYSPRDGEFTLSETGIFNLYVAMDAMLPEVASSTLHSVSTGTLTYNRLSA